MIEDVYTWPLSTRKTPRLPVAVLKLSTSVTSSLKISEAATQARITSTEPPVIQLVERASTGAYRTSRATASPSSTIATTQRPIATTTCSAPCVASDGAASTASTEPTTQTAIAAASASESG